jgi:hypothetical protein
MKRYLPFIIVAVVAIATLGSGAMLYRAKLPQPLTIPEDKSVSGKGDAESMHIRGNPEASVTLEEFGDFECPSCAKLATFLDQVIKEYHPRVRLIFRNFPLPMHQFARDAALAAEAAGLQGRYWEMHDVLYREQPVWSSAKSANDARTLFISYAETLELDLDRFGLKETRTATKPGSALSPINRTPSRWESKPLHHCLSIDVKWDRMTGPRGSAQTGR